jgi:hypothetical protein
MELGAVGEQVLFGARFKLCLWWALASDREVDSCLDFSIGHESPLETTFVRFEKRAQIELVPHQLPQVPPKYEEYGPWTHHQWMAWWYSDQRTSVAP